MDIEKIIKNTTNNNVNKVDWTKAWSDKYPILDRYKNEIDIHKYEKELKFLLDSLQKEYGYCRLDTMLVLKDILYHIYKDNE